jgi:hypothetical protein
MEIPVGIRPYAEVVIDRATGLAHRPAAVKTIIRQTDRWDPDLAKMVKVDVHGWATYPRCLTAPGPDDPRPDTYELSAGWAHHLGHPGCPQCWPEQETPGAPGEE